ncbi:hypothetical protein ACFL6I_24030 [candidate division KSB1 bacterium]
MVKKLLLTLAVMYTALLCTRSETTPGNNTHSNLLVSPDRIIQSVKSEEDDHPFTLAHGSYKFVKLNTQACRQNDNTPLSFDEEEERAGNVVLDDLVVNNSDKKRTMIFKDEHKGIKKMRDLVFSSNLEEAWAYLPDKKRWVEIGRNSTPSHKIIDVFGKEAYETSATIDSAHLIKLMKENDSITLYHFHPDNLEVAKEAILNYKSRDTLDMITHAICAISIIDALHASPSYEDFGSMVHFATTFREINPDSKLKFKICSAIGVTEVELTEKGMNYFKDKNTPCVLNWAGLVGMLPYELMELDGKIESENMVKQIFKYMDNDYVRFKFNSYKSMGIKDNIPSKRPIENYSPKLVEFLVNKYPIPQ